MRQDKRGRKGSNASSVDHFLAFKGIDKLHHRLEVSDKPIVVNIEI